MSPVTRLTAALLESRAREIRDVPKEAPFDPWRLRILEAADFAALPAADQLAYLGWYGLLAPTSHNTVSQRYRLSPSEPAIELWLDRSAVLPASDAVGRQAAVSLGCVAANITLAARAYGWAVEMAHASPSPRDIHPSNDEGPRYVRLSRLAFRPGAAPAEGGEMLRAMLARKVIRAEYDERVKLPPEAVDELHAITRKHPGLELHLLTDSATLLALGKFQELAENTVFNRDAFATELGQWLLENDATSLVGMRGREFGLSDEAARHIHRGLLREEELLPDEMAAFAKGSNVSVRSAAAMAVITVDEDSIPRRLSAGEVYEEIALRLWPRGFATSMQASVVEVEAPNLTLRARLRTRRRPTAVFRMGRPLREQDWHRPHPSRPPLSALILPEDVA